MAKAKKKERSYVFDEWRDTIIGMLLLALIFSYAPNYRNPANMINSFVPALIASGVALLVNKIVHKLAASRLGCASYYKIWMPGIVFALLLMLIGFRFPIVGLVIVQPFAFGRWGMKTRRLSMTEEGLNGLVGPLSNLALAAVFMMIPGQLFGYMAFVSAYFSIFNLIPLKGFDGYRLVYWKAWVWLFLLILNLLFFFV